MHLNENALEIARIVGIRILESPDMVPLMAAERAIEEAVRAYLDASAQPMTDYSELKERLPQRLRALHEHLSHQPLTHADSVDMATILAAAAHIEALERREAEGREVVQAFIDETVDYMVRNNLGDPEKQHNVKWGRRWLEGGAS